MAASLLPFKHPFTSIISGPSGSGKSMFVLRLIDNIHDMIVPSPQKIVYYYTEYQTIFDRYPQVEFRHGQPKTTDTEQMQNCLIVLDDMMTEIGDNVLHLFTRGSHHRQNSIIFLVQNFFNKNKHMRSISLNAHYLVFFKNVRDKSQFVNLAKQIFPTNSRYAVESYINATHEPFGYLMIDLRSEQDEDLRLRTNIFPGEHHTVYVPK